MLTVDQGLMDGQVLQRNRAGRGAALIRGSCGRDGSVECRLHGLRRHPLARWSVVGRASGGHFKAVLASIPAGGPYRAEFRIGEGSPGGPPAVLSFYVGDVWFLAGQSNMQGFGLLSEAGAPHPRVRCFRMDDTWGLARDPLHFLPGAVDPVHHRLCGRSGPLSRKAQAAERAALWRGAGVGLPFCRRMVEWTGVPQGVVACAQGGSRLEQWAPGPADGQSLYGAMLRRFLKLGQKVAGVLWHQGESDAHAARLPAYTPRMIELVAAVRRDFRQPGLPWIMAQLGRHVVDDPPADWNALQEQQRKLPDVIRALAVVPTLDLELDDSVHLAVPGLERLGERMFHAARALVFKDPRATGAIRLRRVRRVVRGPAPGPAKATVAVSFAGVSGDLRAEGGLPWGFSAAAADGSRAEVFSRIRFKGGTVFLDALADPAVLDTLTLHYARGRNAAATIVDGRGMGLPAFGPIPIVPIKGTPYATDWRVAAIGPSGMPVAALESVPAAAGGWRSAARGTAASAFMVYPRPIGENRDGAFLFRGEVRAERPCRVSLAMGADSPFQAWVNGTPAIRAAAATNPCLPGQYEAVVTLMKGPNRLEVAFDARGGRGWGFCLRFEPAGKRRALPAGLLTL